MSIDPSSPESSTQHPSSSLPSSFCATFASPISPKLPAASTAGTEFGWSVATNCDGSQVLIGAGKDPTSVHLYGDDTTKSRNGGSNNNYINNNHNILKTFHNPQWHYDPKKSTFGAAVAMNSNGQRLLIGDPYAKVVYQYDEHGHLMHTFHDPTDNDGMMGTKGISSIFTTSTSTTTTTSEDHVETLFGAKTAVNDDGSVVVIGAEGVTPKDSTTVGATGAVYVYTQNKAMDDQKRKNSNTWTVQTVVDPFPDDNHTFGVSVALSRNGTRLLVGARAPGITDGAAYLYELGGGPYIDVHGRREMADVYQHTTTFTSPHGTSSQWFGGAVDITDDYVVVGARGDAVEDQYQAGAVYVFDVESGQLIDTITQPSGPVRKAEFGSSVAMKGNRLVVTSSFDGTAYAYEMVSRAGLNPRAVLVGKYPVPTNPGYAGGTVALSGDGSLGVVGAPQALGKSGYVKGAAFAICFPELTDAHNETDYSNRNMSNTCPHLHLAPLPWSSMGFWDWDSLSGRILWLILAILVSLCIFQYRPKRRQELTQRRRSFGPLVRRQQQRRQQQRQEFQRLTTISEIELVEEMILS